MLALSTVYNVKENTSVKNKTAMSYTTQPSMFELMRKGDEITWERFYKSYRALVLLRGMDLGISGTDLDELLSRVMLKFFEKRETFRYDPTKGRFRDYFRTVVTTTALDMLREKKKTLLVQNMTPLLENTATEDSAATYENEWRAHIFGQALQEAKNMLPVRAVQAFIMCKLRNIPVNTIAELQQVGKSTVYNDCNNVWEFIKVAVKRMHDEY